MNYAEEGVGIGEGGRKLRGRIGLLSISLGSILSIPVWDWSTGKAQSVDGDKQLNPSCFEGMLCKSSWVRSPKLVVHKRKLRM